MSKKILVVTGSSRIGGNSDLMAEAFIKGAKESGHTIYRFDAGLKNIQSCKACDTCFSTGKACSFNDDFNQLAEYLEKADTIAFFTPLYFFTFPAALKAAIDKLYSFYKSGKQTSIKESMLFVCGETNLESDFGGIIKTYKLIADLQGWKNTGCHTVMKVHEKGV